MLALGLGVLAGAWLALQCATPMPIWLTAATALAALGLMCRGRWSVAGLAAGCALAGLALAQALDDRLDRSLDGQRLEVVGIIEDLPRRESRRLLLTLRVESPPGLPRRVQLSWYEPDAVPLTGERWRFHAKLQRPRGVVNPGGSLRETWLLRQGVGATGYASGPSGGERLVVAADRWLALRGRSAMQIAAAVPERQPAAVLTAITLGFRGGLATATVEALAATGTGHLLAISGLHVGLAAAAGGLLTTALARRIGGRRRPLRDWAAPGALLAAAAYCLLAGTPVSARRAVLMTAAGLAALVLRRGDSLAMAFGGALALVLASDPLAVLDPGLWLSFGAVATILAVVAGRRAAPGKLRALIRIQGALAAGLMVCTVAWFGRVSLVAPLANLLAVPWFSLLVVPPALAGIVLSWLWPAAGGVLLMLAGEATSLALAGIEWFGAWPLASSWISKPGPGALALAAFGATWSLLPRPAPGRLVAPLLFAPLLLGGTTALPHGAFELRVLDVGHGLAALVRTRSRLLLFDAGPAWPGGDAGARTVLPAVRALGLGQLHVLVISHGHADHAGGARAVSMAFPRAAKLAGYGAEHDGTRPCRDGQSWAWDGVRFSLLHPAEGFRGGLNDGSCVLLVDASGGRVLLTGDIESAGERALLRRYPGLPVDLVVAPHHGSRSSSGAALIAATRPAWVVFSTGWRNRWGFPAEAVVARWRRAGALPFSTDRNGESAVQFMPHGPGPPQTRRQLECRAWLDC
jgi:competence protein ComEC